MTVEEWVEQWFERTYCNVLVALTGEWEAIVASDESARQACTQRLAEGYARAGLATSGMWTAYGFLAGKPADLDLLEQARATAAGEPPAADRLGVLFRTRVAITDTIERMYAVYERLAELRAAGLPMEAGEVAWVGAWMEDGGITAGELVAAAADVGVSLGGSTPNR